MTLFNKPLAFVLSCCVTVLLLQSVSFAQPGNEEASEPAVPSTPTGQSESNKEPGTELGKIRKNTRVNLSYYFDSRDYNTMNVLVNSTALPWGFNIFGFSDFHGTETSQQNGLSSIGFIMNTACGGL